MPPSKFKTELARIGNTMNRWKAELRFVLFCAGIVTILGIFSFSDIYVQYQRLGRVSIWLVLIGLMFAASRFMAKCYTEKHSTMGMAAVVELAFPELDNHLINFLQFSQDNDGDPFKRAYLQRGVPEWKTVRVGNMKNKKIHNRAKLVLAMTVVLLLVPFFFNGQAYGVAIWRILNPFSNVQPVSQTLILSVEPGDGSALLGESLIFRCNVMGKKGHEIHLDLKPSDNDATIYSLGAVHTEGTTNSFRYTLKKVTTDVKYRFRAGDAPSPQWYQIKARTPLALSEATVTVDPPGYTRAKAQKYDGLSDDIVILQGSEVELTIECNSELKDATLVVQDREPIKLMKTGEKKWQGAARIDAGGSLRIEANDIYGDELESNIKYTLVADDPPSIEVISPRGKTMLTGASDPLIEFAVVDDYGLSKITIEHLSRDSAGKTSGTAIEKWELRDARDFSELWRHKLNGSGEDRTMTYRIVAHDNNPYKDQLARSQSIVFNGMSTKNATKIDDKLRGQASGTLSKIINIQRNNIDATKRYQQDLTKSISAQWTELATRQTQIRTIAKELLRNPTKPLGALTDRISKCYMIDMPEAVSLLKKATSPDQLTQAKAVHGALQKEEKILRALMSASAAMNQVKTQHKISTLTAMLSRIISGEASVIMKTKTCLKVSVNVAATLVDKQEDLGGDLSEFIIACNAEAGKLGADQRQYIDTLHAVAKLCNDKMIKSDMMVATDKLDSNKPKEALPTEEKALAKLKEVRAEFEMIKAGIEDERLEMMQDVMQDLGDKVSEATTLKALALESMEAMDPNENKNDKEMDMLEGELEELNKNLKESMLDVPADLNIFMDLNVANDLVEDIISIFEEVEQAPGSEAALENLTKPQEFVTAKEASIAEAMEEVEGALDEDLEQWLLNAPNTLAVITEALDQEEMPEEGMALGALKTEVTDIISDLLDQSEDPDDLDLAEDSPTNKALPDPPVGGPVVAGDLAGFGAKGVSGNEKPEHKEQDGRSNVGRQGMSNGECAAGSGTIQEGDPNIEERRTDDPTQAGQVDLDGEADTKATGGGKLGTGKGDEYGMQGGTERMDGTEGPGTQEDLEKLMAKCENTAAKATMSGVKTQALKQAAHYMRQARDAIVQKRPLYEIEEFKKQALASLKRAETQLDARVDLTLDSDMEVISLEDVLDSGSDNAPERYRDLVAEYYKTLSEE